MRLILVVVHYFNFEILEVFHKLSLSVFLSFLCHGISLIFIPFFMFYTALQENFASEAELNAKESRNRVLELHRGEFWNSIYYSHHFYFMCRDHCYYIWTAFDEEKKQHFEIISDMTRQYKVRKYEVISMFFSIVIFCKFCFFNTNQSMREELLKKITDLVESVQLQKDKLGTNIHEFTD